MLLAAFLSVIFFESIVRWFIWNRNHMPFARQIGYFLSMGIPMLSFGGEGFYLVRFYFVYFLMCFLQDALITIPNGYINHSTRIRFVFFGSLHMTIMGLWILLTPYNIWNVLQEKELIVITACISLLILSFLKITSFYAEIRTDFTIYKQQKEDFKNLFSFLNTNIVYLFFEAFFSEYSMNLEMNLSYLMCVNFISIIYISYYMASLSEIFIHAETEISHGYLKKTLGKSDEKLEILRNNAYYDSLTQVYSRLYVLSEMEKYLKEQVAFSLVYLDLNGLKNINDKQGHQEGDAYLYSFAQEIKKRIRSKDIIARYGGDEFLLVFPNCTVSQAKDKIEHIREEIVQEKGRYTFGAGIVDTTEEYSVDGLIAVADRRMYTDKRGGN